MISLRTHLRQSASLVALSLVAFACAGDEPASTGEAHDPLDLLIRKPDVTFEHPGALVPAPQTDWGEAGGVGWARLEPDSAWVHGDGYYIEANQPRAALNLVAPLPSDRTFEIVLWRARRAERSTGTVTITLGGFEIAKRTLADEATTLRIDAPRALWHAGKNVLAFEVDEVEAWSGQGPRWDVLAVASVRYGEARSVAYDRVTGCTLPHLTGFRHMIETTGGAQLELVAASDGPGTLTVTHGTLDARTGESALAAPLELRVDGPFERAFRLPHDAGAVVVADLTWRADDDDALHVSRYQVIEDAPTTRPPVVLISIDTLAARHMGVYGYRRANTPRLTEFAATDAVLFERCVANAPWTLPSYLSALTGLYPGAHSVEDLRAGAGALDNFDFWQAAQNRWTLAEMMRARGYQTAACLDTLWLSPRFQIDQGFDLYDLGPAYEPFHLPENGIRLIRDQFARYLNELPDERAPFFAFIHALDAHGPYFPEAPFLGTYDADLPEDLRPTLAGAAPQTFGAIPDWMATTMTPDAERPKFWDWHAPRTLPLETIIARYDESIQKTDWYIGELLDLLREAGVYDDAVIVITGDHGESFDHDAYSHGVLWEDVLQIPFLIKLPNNAHGGKRIATSIQLVDMYPTLFELVGAGAPREYLHGRSLLPLIRGESDEARPTFSEGGHIDQRSIEADGWKLVESRPGKNGALASLATHPSVDPAWLAKNFPEIASAGMLTDKLRVELEARADTPAKLAELRKLLAGPYYTLYDLTTDPHETSDVASENPQRVTALKKLMREHQATTASARDDANPEPPATPHTSEELEALRALGYTGDK